jgi:hypothetical protein
MGRFFVCVLIVVLVASGAANFCPAAPHFRTVALSGPSGTTLGFGPGLGEEIHYSTFDGASLNNRGDIVFHAQLTGTGITFGNRGGIWTRIGNSNQIDLVARIGPQGPGPNLEDGTFFESLLSSSGYAFNDSGTLAFLGRLNDGSRGVWLKTDDNLTLVARSLDHPPGPNIEGTYFLSFGSLSLNERNEIAFDARISPDFNLLSSERTIWSTVGGTLAVIARGGEPGPGPNHPDGLYYSNFPYSFGFRPRLNDQGQVAFRAQFQGSPSGPFWHSMWLQEGSSVELIARSRHEPGPNLGENWEFTEFWINDGIDNDPEPLLNNRGEVAFRGRADNQIESRAGIWTTAGGTLAPVALSGGDYLGPKVGNGVEFRFDGFTDPAFNDRGEVAFWASLTGSGVVQFANDSGIWTNAGGMLKVVARTGSTEAGPSLGEGVVFRTLGTPRLNDLGQIVFLGSLTGPGIDATNDVGLWSYYGGTLTKIVRMSDSLDVNPKHDVDDFRTVSFISTTTLDLNDRGTVLLRLQFTDGTRGLFTADLRPVPEPSSFAILCIAIPIAFRDRRRSRILGIIHRCPQLLVNQLWEEN